MPSATIPLVGNPNQRGPYGYTALSGGVDQIFKSAFFAVEKNPVTGAGNVYLEKRPGWASSTTPASGLKGSAIYSGTYNTQTFGSSVSTVYVGSVNCGDTDSSGTPNISEAYIGGEVVVLISAGGYGYFVAAAALSAASSFSGARTNGNTVLTGVAVDSTFYVGQALSGTGIASGARIASYDSGAGTVTMTLAATSGAATVTSVSRTKMARIIDADFAGAVGGFVELDGYVFTVSSDGLKIQHSDLNSVISWSASSIISANAVTDALVCVKKLKNKILAFGQRSIEFFYNAGNPAGSVLSRIADATINIGTLSGNSVSSFGDEIYFFGYGVGPSSGLWVISDGIRKISTSSVEKSLNSSLFGYVDCFTFSGQKLIHFSLGNGTTLFNSYLYDVNTGIWTNSGFPFHFRISTSTSDSLWAVSINDTSGILYRMDSDNPVYTDNGSAYSLSCQTSKTDFGSERLKTIKSVSLLGADIQSSGSATLEYSDNDYSSWTTAGTFDLTTSNPRIYRCGSFKGGRAWRLTHSANTAFRAQSLKFEYDEAEH